MTCICCHPISANCAALLRGDTLFCVKCQAYRWHYKAEKVPELFNQKPMAGHWGRLS